MCVRALALPRLLDCACLPPSHPGHLVSPSPWLSFRFRHSLSLCFLDCPLPSPCGAASSRPLDACTAALPPPLPPRASWAATAHGV